MESTSPATKIFGPIPFIVGAITALAWFGYKTLELISHINTEVVVFDKGAMYMLGVGLGLGVLAVVTTYEFWGSKPLSKAWAKACTLVAIISLTLLLALPALSDWILSGYMQENGYVVCENASRSWLFSKQIVYSKLSCPSI